MRRSSFSNDSNRPGTDTSSRLRDRPESTHTRRWRFSGPLTDVLCKRPFAEFVEINRIRCKESLLISISDGARLQADRPLSKISQCVNDPDQPLGILESGLSTDEAGSCPSKQKCRLGIVRTCLVHPIIALTVRPTTHSAISPHVRHRYHGTMLP